MAKTGFGRMLRQLRLERNLGIKKLAPELGVNYTYLSKLENEKANPSADLIKRIAEFFGCDVDELFLAANKLPQDVIEAIRERPEVTLPYLRRISGRGGRRT